MSKETIAQKRERLQREMEQLNAAETKHMEKAITRAKSKVRSAIDQAAADIARASAELDGEEAITEEELREQLYAEYGIGEESSGGVEAPGGETSSPGTEEEKSPASDTPSTEQETSSSSGESEMEEEEAPERDEKPPATHWSERPIFKRNK